MAKSTPINNSNASNSATSWKKPSELVKKFGITDETLRRWANENKINYIFTPGGHRLYDASSLSTSTSTSTSTEETKSSREGRRTILYARVSSTKQKDKGDLERQCKMLTDKYPEGELIKDIGSGINFKRKGLRKILELGFQGNLSEIVVVHSDRLARFATDLLKWIIEQHGAKFTTMEDRMDVITHSPYEELAEDLLSIVTVFSSRYYGMRRYSKKRERDETTNTRNIIEEECDDGKGEEGNRDGEDESQSEKDKNSDEEGERSATSSSDENSNETNRKTKRNNEKMGRNTSLDLQQSIRTNSNKKGEGAILSKTEKKNDGKKRKISS